MSAQMFNNFHDFGRSMGVPDRRSQAPNNPLGQPQEQMQKVMPEFLNEKSDYVTIAEQKIKSLGTPDRNLPGKLYFGNLTTSKIRNILSLVNQPYNQVILCRGDLSEDMVNSIRYLKVRLVYEAGREPAVLNFCQTTGLIDAVDFIGNSRRLFLRYAKYMEALVAYHRFYNSRND